MTEFKPGEVYISRLNILDAELKQLKKKKSRLAWLRLISFLAAVAALWILLPYGWYLAVAAAIILLGIFFFIVSKDLSNSNAIENNKLLIDINRDELSALNNQFTHFPDGAEWKPARHDYANDLDIFGRASLYQYINRTSSQQGNKLMAGWLLSPSAPAEIEQRQEAAKELKEEMEWRQQLQAYGINKRLTIPTQENIEYWLAEETAFIKNKSWNLLRFAFPLSSLTVLFLYIFDVIAQGPFLFIMLLFLAVSFWISKRVMPAYVKLNKITAELETFSGSIQWIEKKSFRSPLLLQIKKRYETEGASASQTIKSLKKILDRLDYRLNPVVFIPLSAFLCWDLQQIFALEKWKTKNQSHIPQWFAALAETEAISTIANLSFNHPGWCFPVLIKGESVFKAETMGHPLIPKGKRVDNSFSTEGTPQISLVTGSNMAGKSTFLRSIGINMVLAMTGAPVCAKSLLLSPVKVMSSMRVNDNLEESTSTFYAELKKLKEMIEAVYRNEKVFLLLDEILKGTNSADRYTGSAALLKQLVQHKAVCMIATHDLQLAKLEEEYPASIHNYHFDVQVENDELFFDYKLKKGICQSMNASILMRKIGIEL
jgi:MutS domain V